MLILKEYCWRLSVSNRVEDKNLKEKIVSYSQDYEDIILYHVLKDIEKIFWIDVGANDPVYISVTKFFSVRGGYGINIEPQRNFYERLVKDRPNDINLQLGISDRAGELTLYGDGSVATFDKKTTVADKTRSYSVKTRTLKSICDTYVSEKTIHFLKIDVEGWELQVLNGMDFVTYRPWIVCIEAFEPWTEIENYLKWEHVLIENRYHYVKTIGFNRWYVANEKEILDDKILKTGELRKIYDISNFYCKKYNGIRDFLIKVYWMDGMKKFRNLWRKIKWTVKKSL